jgi:hypothetical protein
LKKKKTLAIEPRNLEAAVDAASAHAEDEPVATAGGNEIATPETSVKKTLVTTIASKPAGPSKNPDDIDGMSTGALDTALLSSAEFEFEDLHKLLLQRYQVRFPLCWVYIHGSLQVSSDFASKVSRNFWLTNLYHSRLR